MLIFTCKVDATATDRHPDLTLQLTAQDRTRSRHRFDHPNGTALFLQLPRGSHLHNGDLLQTDDRQTTLKIEAKPEPLLTVTADPPPPTPSHPQHLQAVALSSISLIKASAEAIHGITKG